MPIKEPHANAFLDLNNDFYSDLVVTTNEYFEIWHGKENGFDFHKIIKHPPIEPNGFIGQSLHLDVELMGKIDLILPVCSDETCVKSSIWVHSETEGWNSLQFEFKDNSNVMWGFAKDGGQRYTDAITLRGGDFNMDGYPDLLATLRSSANQHTRSFLLENIHCDSCTTFNRTFKIRWDALNPFNNESVMAVFYDFYQDGMFFRL